MGRPTDLFSQRRQPAFLTPRTGSDGSDDGGTSPSGAHAAATGFRTRFREPVLLIGVTLVIDVPEPGEFRSFVESHFPLLEQLLHRFKGTLNVALAEKAHPHRNPAPAASHRGLLATGLQRIAAGLHTDPSITVAAAALRKQLDSLYSAPRIKAPVWLELQSLHQRARARGVATMVGDPDAAVATTKHQFAVALRTLIRDFDRTRSQDFLATTLTLVLRHHRGWVDALCQAEQAGAGGPPVPVPGASQLRALFGANGTFASFSRTVVVGRNAAVVERFLVVLSYFVRCDSVFEMDIEPAMMPFTSCFNDNPFVEPLVDVPIDDAAAAAAAPTARARPAADGVLGIPTTSMSSPRKKLDFGGSNCGDGGDVGTTPPGAPRQPVLGATVARPTGSEGSPAVFDTLSDDASANRRRLPTLPARPDVDGAAATVTLVPTADAQMEGVAELEVVPTLIPAFVVSPSPATTVVKTAGRASHFFDQKRSLGQSLLCGLGSEYVPGPALQGLRIAPPDDTIDDDLAANIKHPVVGRSSVLEASCTIIDTDHCACKVVTITAAGVRTASTHPGDHRHSSNTVRRMLATFAACFDLEFASAVCLDQLEGVLLEIYAHSKLVTALHTHSKAGPAGVVFPGMNATDMELLRAVAQVHPKAGGRL